MNKVDTIIENIKANNHRIYFNNDEAYSFLESHDLFKEIANSDIPKKTFEYLSGMSENGTDRNVADYFAHILFEYFCTATEYEPFINLWFSKKVFAFSQVKHEAA